MTQMSLPDMIEKVKPSVVEVLTDDGTGSGIIVDARGLVVTNRHVVATFTDVKVKTAAEKVVDAKVVRADGNVDYAILKTEITDTPVLSLADAVLREGQTVVAIGHPLGYEFTVTKGIVSARCRKIKGVDYIQTDCSINPGNSGGPLLTETGEVVGINTWIRGDAQNIGFAIPVRYVKAALAELEPKLARLESCYYCNLCGFLNDTKKKYCGNCGAPTEKPAPPPATELVCASCQTPNPTHARFCKKCGASLAPKT